jgi:hypothetical protein
MSKVMRLKGEAARKWIARIRREKELSERLDEIPEVAEIEAEVTLWCDWCGDRTWVGVLDATDTWHDVWCMTCGREYAVVLKLEAD